MANDPVISSSYTIMGAGGQFIIINETEYNWKVEKDGGYEAYQMNNWIPNQDVGARENPKFSDSFAAD